MKQETPVGAKLRRLATAAGLMALAASVLLIAGFFSFRRAYDGFVLDSDDDPTWFLRRLGFGLLAGAVGVLLAAALMACVVLLLLLIVRRRARSGP